MSSRTPEETEASEGCERDGFALDDRRASVSPDLPAPGPLASPAEASLHRYLRYLHAESQIPGSALHDEGASRAAEQLLVSLMRAAATPVDVGRECREAMASVPTGATDGRLRLTARETEIARLVAGGFNNLEIANGLSISRNTVKEALKRIFRKVAVDSRAELVLRLAEARLL